MKEMWKVIKQRGLQDPANKQFMIVEADMMPIFKLKKVKTFGKHHTFCETTFIFLIYL